MIYQKQSSPQNKKYNLYINKEKISQISLYHDLATFP